MSLVKIPIDDRWRLEIIFSQYENEFLIDSILEGHCGEAIADDLENPNMARLAYADIMAFAGNVNHQKAAELIADLPYDKVIIPGVDGWDELIKSRYGDEMISIQRQAFSEKNLDVDHLKSLMKQPPKDFELRRIDLRLAKIIFDNPDLISEDHVRNFGSPEQFFEKGIGFCILKDDRIVSGSSSYTVCNKGIEIQVNTHPDLRGNNLATVVCAALMVYCLENNITPHWDAGNEVSIKLAKRLGFEPTKQYEMLLRAR